MSARASLGQRAEREAALYLERAGWQIMARQWRGQRGELDVVAMRLEQRYGQPIESWIIVEVKARSQPRGRPEWQAVSARKRQRIALAAQEFLSALPWPSPSGLERAVRFDVIGAQVMAGELALRHIEGAFDAEGQL